MICSRVQALLNAGSKRWSLGVGSIQALPLLPFQASKPWRSTRSTPQTSSMASTLCSRAAHHAPTPQLPGYPCAISTRMFTRTCLQNLGAAAKRCQARGSLCPDLNWGALDAGLETRGMGFLGPDTWWRVAIEMFVHGENRGRIHLWFWFWEIDKMGGSLICWPVHARWAWYENNLFFTSLAVRTIMISVLMLQAKCRGRNGSTHKTEKQNSNCVSKHPYLPEHVADNGGANILASWVCLEHP